MNLKLLKKYAIIFLIMVCYDVNAQQTPPSLGAFQDNSKNPINDSLNALEDIKKEILNFGYSFGYPIDPSTEPPTLDKFFLNNVSNVVNLEKSVVKQLVSIFSSNVFQPSFIPTSASGGDSSTYSALNDLANTVLRSDAFYNAKLDIGLTKSPDPNNMPFSPASQMILNLLSYTPDDACIEGSGSNRYWKTSCEYTFPTMMIYANALGLNFEKGNLLAKTVTSANLNALSDNTNFDLKKFFPNKDNPQSQVLPQVDSSLFLSPLVYNSQNNNESGGGGDKPLTGLGNNNQLEAAQSYLRNVTGSILPPSIADKATINQVQTKIVGASNIDDQLSAFKNWSRYILGTRVFAARESVALQNIYEMMSRRMPYTNQTTSNNDSNVGIPAPQAQSSQALNEFIMATYRLYNPGTDNSGGNGGQNQAQWQNMIAIASSANVQKETALLLAEINYQLYLMRQQQERVLLTNSLLLLNSLQYPNLEPPP